MAAYLLVKAQLMECDTMRKNMEEEMGTILEQLGPIGMKEELVDAEGFPRSDVDVFTVRTLRHKMVCLQNDYKSIMKTLDSKLAELHKLEPPVASPAAQDRQLQSRPGPPVAFALVDEVTKDSPASEAGMQVGDRIVSIGSLGVGSSAASPTLLDVGTLVRASEGSQLVVAVQRDAAGTVTLSLTPKRWSGPGLLGCHIVQIQER